MRVFINFCLREGIWRGCDRGVVYCGKNNTDKKSEHSSRVLVKHTGSCRKRFGRRRGPVTAGLTPEQRACVPKCT